MTKKLTPFGSLLQQAAYERLNMVLPEMMPIAHKPAPVFTRSKPFPSVMIEIGHSYEGIFESVKEIPGDAVIESITPTEDGQAVVLTFTESE